MAYKDDVDARCDGWRRRLSGDFEVNDVVEEQCAEGGDGRGEVTACFVCWVDEGKDVGIGEGAG